MGTSQVKTIVRGISGPREYHEACKEKQWVCGWATLRLERVEGARSWGHGLDVLRKVTKV